MSKGFNVEIIGPPGCGKTTLAKRLMVDLSSQNIATSLNKRIKKPRVADILSLRGLTFFLSALKVFRVVVYLNYRKNRFNYRYWKVVIRGWLKVVLIKFYQLHQGQNTIRISEPGYLMLLLGGCMYRDKAVENKKLSKMIKKICDIDVLIVVEIEERLSLDRMNNRERGEPIRMKGEGLERKLDIIRSSRDYTVEISNVCEKKGALVVYADGGGPADALSAEICKQIKGFYEKNH